MIIYLLKQIASLIIGALELCMLVRAIMSWIMPDEDSGLSRFIYGITEPLIAPMRALLNRFSFVQRCPIDLSFSAVCLILILIEMLLSA